MSGELAGVRVMLTRPAAANDHLANALREAGAVVESVPLVRIAPPSDPAPLLVAAQRSSSVDWLVFTSANGVAALSRARRDPLPARVRIAAVGPATAAAVQTILRRPVDLIPEQHGARSLASAIIAAARPRQDVIVFQPEDVESGVVAPLRSAGHAVSIATAYRTIEEPPSDLSRRIAAVDVIVLTSGSGARSLKHGLAASASNSLRGKTLVVIGESTASEARRAGIEVDAVAPQATPAGIMRAIAQARRRASGLGLPKAPRR